MATWRIGSVYIKGFCSRLSCDPDRLNKNRAGNRHTGAAMLLMTLLFMTIPGLSRKNVQAFAAPELSLSDVRPNSTAFLIFCQKLPDALHRGFFRIDTVEKLRPVQWVPSEEALVEHLSTAEGTTGDIPGQAEELDALSGAGGVGGQVLLDLRF
jgi:hypothetical protein